MEIKTTIRPQSSGYIEQQRRDYAMYVLQFRAIPSIADGVVVAARRVLWMARSGNKFKSATLAGSTMPIHPHASPETVVNTLAMPYGNNVPLLEGYGNFGTRLKPNACSASRYTSVKMSDFAESVMLVDSELIPMRPNYDMTLEEPVNFLPLVPICLLNPSEGIAVGFASNILPRSLEDVISNQISYLQGKKFKEPNVYFAPLKQQAVREDSERPNRWTFKGTMEIKNTTTVVVTDLAYGITHDSFVDRLNTLLNDGVIVNYVDDSSNSIKIEIKFERKTLSELDEPALRKLLKIDNSINENMVLIDFNGKTVLTTDYTTVIQKFTNWRLEFYKPRYELLKQQLEVQMQRYRDVITAINKNVGAKVKTISSRKDLVAYLSTISIVHTDYIADLPVYRFTEEEKAKVQAKLDEAEKTLKRYNALINSEDERRQVYISELRDVLKRFK